MKDIEILIKENPKLLEEYPILDIEYNKDGTKKEFYYLASEKDIKETQIKSDEKITDNQGSGSSNKIKESEELIYKCINITLINLLIIS